MIGRLTPSASRLLGKASVYIGLSYFLVFIGQNIWRSTFHNYAVEHFHFSPIKIGLAFSLISLPGLFSATLGFISPRVKLVILLTAACFMIGGGLVGSGLSQSWPLLLFSILVLHSGFAVYYPTINTIFLLGVKPKQAVKRLSSLKSLGPFASLVATALLMIVLAPYGYVPMLAISGGAVLATGLLCAFNLPESQATDRQNRLRFKKKLTPYYLLNFLNGCRSGIFKTFVLYYLITEFNFELKNTAAIVLAGNGLTFLGYQLVGRLSAKYDPGKVLVFLYIIMFLNFLGFWSLQRPELLSLLYLVDSMVFCTSAITDGCLKFISTNEDLLGDIAAGVSLYHLGGVIMPVVGGLLYNRQDLDVFLLGSLCALLSIWTASCLIRQNAVRKNNESL